MDKTSRSPSPEPRGRSPTRHSAPPFGRRSASPTSRGNGKSKERKIDKKPATKTQTEIPERVSIFSREITNERKDTPSPELVQRENIIVVPEKLKNRQIKSPQTPDTAAEKILQDIKAKKGEAKANAMLELYTVINDKNVSKNTLELILEQAKRPWVHDDHAYVRTDALWLIGAILKTGRLKQDTINGLKPIVTNIINNPSEDRSVHENSRNLAAWLDIEVPSPSFLSRTSEPTPRAKKAETPNTTTTTTTTTPVRTLDQSEIADLQSELTKAVEIAANMEAQISKLQSEVENYRDLQTSLSRLNTDYDEATAAYEMLSSQRERDTTALQQKKQEIQALKKERAELESTLKETIAQNKKEIQELQKDYEQFQTMAERAIQLAENEAQEANANSVRAMTLLSMTLEGVEITKNQNQELRQELKKSQKQKESLEAENDRLSKNLQYNYGNTELIEADLNRSKQQIKNLETLNKKLQASNTQLKRQGGRNKGDRLQVEQLKKENTELKQQRDEFETNYYNTANQVVEMQEVIATNDALLGETSDALERTKNLLIEISQERTKDNEKFTTKIKTQGNKIEELEKQLTEARQENQTTLAQLSAENERLKAEAERAKELEKQLAENKGQLEEKEKRLASREKMMEGWTPQIETQNTRIQQYQTKNKELEQEIKNLKQLQQKLETQGSLTHTEISKAKAEYEKDLKEKEATFRKQAEAFQREKAAITKELETLRQQTSTAQTTARAKQTLEQQNASLQEQLRQSEQSATQAKQETENLRNEAEEYKAILERQLETFKIQANKAADAKVQKAEQRVNKANEQLKAKEAELASLKRKNQEASNERTQLTTTNTTLSEYITQQEQVIAEKDQSANIASEQLKTREAELATLRQQIEQLESNLATRTREIEAQKHQEAQAAAQAYVTREIEARNRELTEKETRIQQDEIALNKAKEEFFKAGEIYEAERVQLLQREAAVTRLEEQKRSSRETILKEEPLEESIAPRTAEVPVERKQKPRETQPANIPYQTQGSPAMVRRLKPAVQRNIASLESPDPSIFSLGVVELYGGGRLPLGYNPENDKNSVIRILSELEGLNKKINEILTTINSSSVEKLNETKNSTEELNQMLTSLNKTYEELKSRSDRLEPNDEIRLNGPDNINIRKQYLHNLKTEIDNLKELISYLPWEIT